MGSRPPDSKCFLLPHPTCWSQEDSVHTSLPRPRGSTATISIGSTTLTKPTLSHLPGRLCTRFQPNRGKEVGDRRGPGEAHTGTLEWGGHSWELQERNAAGDDEIWAWTGAEWRGDTTLAMTSEDIKMKEEAVLPTFWLGIQKNGSWNGQNFGHLI